MSEEGDAVGLEIFETATGKSLFFIPGCAGLVFFDGTLWRDEEMIRLGIGSKTGRRMGPACALSPDHELLATARGDAEAAAPAFIYRQHSAAPPRLPERIS